MKKIIIIIVSILLVATIFLLYKQYRCNQKNKKAIENNIQGPGFGRFGKGDVYCQ